MFLKNVCFLSFVVMLWGCGGSKGSTDAGSAEETTGTCQTQGAAHSGCCSGHGGFTGVCSVGNACYTASGKLVCADGTISASCTFNSKPEVNLIENSELFVHDLLYDDTFSTLTVTCQ